MNVLPDSQIAIVQQLFIVEARSIREVQKLVGIARGTAQRYRDMIKMPVLCACGRDAKHKGWCKVRFARSPGRQEYMKRHWEAQKTPDWVKNLAKQHPAVPDITECYPYIGLSKEDRLILAVNEAVPKEISNDARADICQDILVEVLSGRLSEDEISAHVPQAIRNHRKLFGRAPNILSLDAENENGLTIYGTFRSVNENLPDAMCINHEEWEEEQKYRSWQRRHDEPDLERQAELRESLLGYRLAGNHQRRREEARA